MLNYFNSKWFNFIYQYELTLSQIWLVIMFFPRFRTYFISSCIIYYVCIVVTLQYSTITNSGLTNIHRCHNENYNIMYLGSGSKQVRKKWLRQMTVTWHISISIYIYIVSYLSVDTFWTSVEIKLFIPSDGVIQR